MRTLVVLIAVTLASLGCARSPGEPSAPQATNAPALATPSVSSPGAPALPPGHPPTGILPFEPPSSAAAQAGGLAWTDPPGWQRVPPASRMRRAQYSIPRAAGDDGDAELIVITFGPGQGGDTNANLERWYGQVTQPDGRATRDVATRNAFTVGSLSVTETEAAGRLGSSGMAMPGVPPSPTVEHGRLLAAIVETPSGPWFFKMTGPDHTVAAARSAFDTMIRSVHAQ